MSNNAFEGNDPPAPEVQPAGVENHCSPVTPDSTTAASARLPGEPPPAPPAIPDHTLLRRIGGGSYGEVWLARNVMGTYRAVKIVYRQRFQTERPFEREFHGIQTFEPVSRGHESLIDVLHVGRNDAEGYFYYVMELADDDQSGPDLNPDRYTPRTLLRQNNRQGHLPLEECLRLGLSLTRGLDYLHQHGLVHRDLKPSNIIFAQGVAKLADIGLVTEASDAKSWLGTEGFIPPEGAGTPQADIYGLGKVLYEISTGKDRTEFPDPPTLTGEEPEAQGLRELNEVLMRACHPDPRHRYQTATQMHDDLALVRGGKSVRLRRQTRQWVGVLARTVLATALVALVYLVGMYYHPPDQPQPAAAAIPRILLFADGPLTSPYQMALNNKGYNADIYSDENSFNLAVAAANPRSTVVLVDSTWDTHTFSTLPGYVTNGGKALLQYWGLNSETSLGAAFQVTPGPVISNPPPLHAWGDSPLLAGLSLPLTRVKCLRAAGLHLTPIGSGQAVAGHTSDRITNRTALVVGNAGRTIVHGFIIEDLGCPRDAVQLAENEIDALVGPPPAAVPRVTVQPQARIVIAGASARLEVCASGSVPFHYQWQKDGANIPRANDRRYHLAGVKPLDTGRYSVTVSNAFGTVASAPALLMVSNIARIAKVHVLHDSPWPCLYVPVLENSGLGHQLYNSSSSFESAIAAASAANTLAIVDASWMPHYLSELEDFVKAGGRVILHYWNLQSGSSLAATFQVNVTATLSSSPPLFDWGQPGFFNGVLSPLVLTNFLTLKGQKLQPLSGSGAAAGHRAGETEGHAAIVVGNQGRTIVNGFVAQEITATNEVIRLLQNQIEYLARLGANGAR